jgi:hypothetical protein
LRTTGAPNLVTLKANWFVLSRVSDLLAMESRGSGNSQERVRGGSKLFANCRTALPLRNSKSVPDVNWEPARSQRHRPHPRTQLHSCSRRPFSGGAPIVIPSGIYQFGWWVLREKSIVGCLLVAERKVLLAGG